MKKILKKIVFLIGIITFLFVPLYPVGILTPFTECRIDNIVQGEKYLLNMPLKVKNTDSSSIEIEVEVIKPSLSELKEDYNQIPDIRWITIEKSSFTIEAGKWIETNVFIEVPKDKRRKFRCQWRGNKYQAYLLTKTVGGGGRIQAGLKSRILFSVKERKGFFKRIFGWIFK